MKFRVLINCDGPAFEERVNVEVAEILRKLAGDLLNSPIPSFGIATPIRDSRNMPAGAAEFTEQ